VLQEASYPAVHYLPLEDVDADVLRPSAHETYCPFKGDASYYSLADVRSDVLKPSDHTTYCPFKGDASYYSIATADGELTDAVWYYREPYPAVAAIAGHVAFYANRVDISVG